MASILNQPSDCCNTCCPVQIVDLPPSGGGSGVNSYPTIADLRNETRVTVLVLYSFATVYGDVAPDDGGGGLYFYDPSDMQPDDDISVIIPNSVVRPSPGSWIKFFG